VQVTFTCSTESGQETHNIVVCQDQAFENFLDMIVNEFGTQLWPSMPNPTGGILVIDSDDAFELLISGLDAHACIMGARNRPLPLSRSSLALP
jgi:hypothetical protein